MTKEMARRLQCNAVVTDHARAVGSRRVNVKLVDCLFRRFILSRCLCLRRLRVHEGDLFVVYEGPLMLRC